MAEFSTSRGGFGVRQLLYVAPNQAKRGIWFDTVTCKYASAQGKKGGGWGWCQYTIIRTGGYRASPVVSINDENTLTSCLESGGLQVKFPCVYHNLSVSSLLKIVPKSYNRVCLMLHIFQPSFSGHSSGFLHTPNVSQTGSCEIALLISHLSALFSQEWFQ